MKLLESFKARISWYFFIYWGRIRSFFFKSNKLITQDRIVLEEKIFPTLSSNDELKKILFVGCEWYTKDYQDFFKNKEYWTIDFNKKVARFGSVNHIINKLENAGSHFQEGYLDLIICNGILGYGLETKKEAEIAFETCYKILRNGGLLLIGWNFGHRENMFDPRELSALKNFKPIIFSPLDADRYKVEGTTNHVYDFYIKDPEETFLKSIE